MIPSARPIISEAFPRHLGGISQVLEISRRSKTKGVFVSRRSRINLDDGGKDTFRGYLMGLVVQGKESLF